MRRMLILAATAALFALALPGYALADDPVFPGDPYESVNEVRDISTGEPCGEVAVEGTEASGGCDIGPASFKFSITSTATVRSCPTDADRLLVGTDGELALADMFIHPTGGGGFTCGGWIEVCAVGEDQVPWHGSLYVDPAQPGKLFGYLPVCFADPETGIYVYFDYFSVEVQVDENNHFLGWTHAASSSGDFFTNNWSFSDSVEIDY